jgi:hypothetical protein
MTVHFLPATRHFSHFPGITSDPGRKHFQLGRIGEANGMLRGPRQAIEIGRERLAPQSGRS